ncbi:hypothetical protein [Paenibacillus sp. FSL M7-1046]|uniref:hypothetical protein n=1 Tax=Paenibacillus sp. FSL M7-1046 TaxID=2975315 RepID=UPI0030F5566F
MSVLRINWHRKHGLYSIYFVTPIVGYGPALVDCRESGLLMPLLYSAAKGRPPVSAGGGPAVKRALLMKAQHSVSMGLFSWLSKD